MLKIDPRYVEAVESADKSADLFESLQKAVELEHATIPPYLVAAYSLKPGVNSEISEALKDIAQEEMLHMAIAANILIAIGGRPRFDDAQFLPKYPGPLPMNIGTSLQVGLQKFSKELVRDVFMQIEKPENPLEFPVTAEAQRTYATIGSFYTALSAAFKRLGNGIFVGDPAKQVIVDAGFPSEQLFPITDADLATKALDWIRVEGEGTPTTPLDRETEPAHYYRFAEILHGKHLIKGEQFPDGYAYGGPVIRFEANEVYDVPDNAKAADYAPGSPARTKIDAFNQEYCNMLRMLQKAFDGQPGEIKNALAAMGLVRRVGATVIKSVDPATLRNLPLTFEYMPPKVS